MTKIKGRLTLPGDYDFYDETKELMQRWGADAIRDSDGTKLADDIQDLDAKIYTTYFVARGHNDFAMHHLDECQQLYLISDYNLATSDTVVIDYLNGYLREQIAPDYEHDPKEWWEVIDRTSNRIVPLEDWSVDQETHHVTIKNAIPFHEYTVNFLSYMIWDPTQMYNHITNDWGDKPKDLPFDVRGPNSNKFMREAMVDFMENNPKTDVVRFTTFYYHFTLFFNDKRKEKFVDWFGYGSSVSPAAILAFEAEYGYRLRPEDFIQNGYYNSTFCLPSKEYSEYIDFQQRFVAAEAKALVDIVHSYGKEAMMFLGDNWIGTEPYGKYFHTIGMDAVVGSVGGGATLRLIGDIPHVKYTEGRFLPYFFPDTFFEGNDFAIINKAVENWLGARRAILRKPLNRIGYGGYPSLAYKHPEFIQYVEDMAHEFRVILDNIEGKTPHSPIKVGILNAWGKIRSWQAFMVAHALWYKQTYSYFGILESLSGMGVDVEFLSFDDIKDGISSDIDIIVNAGDRDTAFSGGVVWDNPEFVAMIRQWVYEGHGFIGIGEPTAYEKGGHFFQLADVLGVDKELGFTLSTDKYFNKPLESHFITEGMSTDFNSGEEINNVYAKYETTEIIAMKNGNVTMAAHTYGKGRGIYLAGLPYTPENSKAFYRAMFYSLQKEDEINVWYAQNPNVEVHVYPEISKVAIVNNTNEEQTTIIFDGAGSKSQIVMAKSEIRWEAYNEEGKITNS